MFGERLAFRITHTRVLVEELLVALRILVAEYGLLLHLNEPLS